MRKYRVDYRIGEKWHHKDIIAYSDDEAASIIQNEIPEANISIPDPCMSDEEIKGAIKRAIKRYYLSRYYQPYLDEFIKWYDYDSDWMWQFSDAEVDEAMSEAEIKEIDTVIREAWNEYWEENTDAIDAALPEGV